MALNKTKGPKDKPKCPRVQKRFMLNVRRFRLSKSSPQFLPFQKFLFGGNMGVARIERLL